jgi:PAS domain S-box-containing protein
MAKIFGYGSVRDFCEISVAELYTDIEDRRKFLEEMRTKGFVKDRLIAMRKKDGTRIWCSVTAVAHCDNEGRLEYSDGVLEDVTEQKRLEEHLRHSQKMEAIGILTGGVAHDFNNILTAILGYANLLKLKMPPDTDLEEYVEQILTSSEKAANLTRSLLAFSRKQLNNPQLINLNGIVRGVEKLLARIIGEDVDFNVILADRDLVILADSGQIEQILLNLAINARDAMVEGGLLTIETSLTGVIPRSGGFPNVLEPGNYAVIAMSDTGIGMDEAMFQRIFEPFFTTKEVGRGTGLGLSTVYGIVQQHKGHIHVYSEPGNGTTFKIYLPVIEQPEKSNDDKAKTTFIGGTETILVAEDDEDVRNLICSMLQKFGYTVIEAVDGQDAVEKFTLHKEEVDLLLLDVVMPRMNGKECLDRIREMNVRVPVVFSSGYTADIIYAKGIHEAGAGFLQKPVQPKVLLAAIRQSLQGTG